MKRARGFTLIEMMIVVAILGILASIAIPAFNKYVRRAKTTEGIMNLRKLFDGSVAYYERDFSDRFGRSMPAQFPGGGVKLFGPGGNQNPCCNAAAKTDKCPPNPGAWGHPVWQGLNFAVDDPHYFWYGYTSAEVGVDAQFTASAHANLNCFGPFSTFERVGAVSAEGNVVGGAGIFSVRPLE